MRVLGISGSLREGSTNSSLLRALALLAAEPVRVRIYGGLGGLPHFNADLDVEPGLGPVKEWREELAGARAVVISTPEYAHGLPGSLKNALDWVVRSGEFYEKPVAIINASPRAVYAQESLREVLTTMGARVLPEASVTIPLLGAKLTTEEIAGNGQYAGALREALRALVRGAGVGRGE
jgi:chromate reductase